MGKIIIINDCLPTHFTVFDWNNFNTLFLKSLPKMKKLLLVAGAVYGVYMLLKQLGTPNNLALVASDFDEDPVGNGTKKMNSKAKEHHHGDIRKLMKKASAISHHLE